MNIWSVIRTFFLVFIFICEVADASSPFVRVPGSGRVNSSPVVAGSAGQTSADLWHMSQSAPDDDDAVDGDTLSECSFSPALAHIGNLPKIVFVRTTFGTWDPDEPLQIKLEHETQPPIC